MKDLPRPIKRWAVVVSVSKFSEDGQAVRYFFRRWSALKFASFMNAHGYRSSIARNEGQFRDLRAVTGK